MRPRRDRRPSAPSLSAALRSAAVLGLAAVLASCGGPAQPFGTDRACNGDEEPSGERPVAVEAEVGAGAGTAAGTALAEPAPGVWAGFQRRDGSVVTALPACFDGVLALFLADSRDGTGLEAEVERAGARAVPARDGAGELLVRDSASFHAELLEDRDDAAQVGSFTGWYVHLEEPARGTYAWESPVTWQEPGGGAREGTVAVRVVVG